MRVWVLCLCACNAAPNGVKWVRWSTTPSAISGVVVDENGQPAQASVGVGWTVSTEEAFSFEGLTPGNHTLSAYAEIGEAHLELTLEPGERLDGLVVELAPVPELAVVEDGPPLEEEPDDDERQPQLPASFWHDFTLENVDESGRPLAVPRLAISTSTWLEDEQSCEVQLLHAGTFPRRDAQLWLPHEPTSVCPRAPGWLVDCVHVTAEQERAVAHYRRGSRVQGVIRGASDDPVDCGGGDTFTGEHGELDITCPEQATLRIGEAEVQLPTRAGEDLYVEVVLGD